MSDTGKTISMVGAAGLTFPGSVGGHETVDPSAGVEDAGLWYYPPPSGPLAVWEKPASFDYDAQPSRLDAIPYEDNPAGPGQVPGGGMYGAFATRLGRRTFGDEWVDRVAVLSRADRLHYSDPSLFSSVTVRMGFEAVTSLVPLDAVRAYDGSQALPYHNPDGEIPHNVVRSIALDEARSEWFEGDLGRGLYYLTPHDADPLTALVPYHRPEYAPLGLSLGGNVVHDDNLVYSSLEEKIKWEWTVDNWTAEEPVGLFPAVSNAQDGPYFHLGFGQRQVWVGSSLTDLDADWRDETLSSIIAYVKIIAVPIDAPPITLAVRGYSHHAR